MRVFIHAVVYCRTKEFAKALHLTVSQFVERALKQVEGMEGIPLRKDETWGEGKEEDEKNQA